MTRWLIGVLIVFGSCAAAPVQDRQWGPPQDLCELDDPQIDESSGVAASNIEAGVFYTHNDSGDKARFFRFNRDGEVEGTYELALIEARDWEDMASAVVDGNPYIYLGDIGDNARVRDEIVIYRVHEPTWTDDGFYILFESYTLKYPDKAHDCEAMFVTQTGDIYLVTKARDGVTGVYMLKKPTGSGSYTLRHIRNIPVDTKGFGGTWVTGGDVSPDGKHVVIRTYSAALEYEVPEEFEDWVNQEPKQIRLPIEVQGEAICYSKDGHYLITTSERAPCPVSILRLKN
ncbi:MAG: hypothetical protein IH944_04605 [Armatimonadetes bacterium]|nr:hypothetical protein [Armatimonadota bacterium]